LKWSQGRKQRDEELRSSQAGSKEEEEGDGREVMSEWCENDEARMTNDEGMTKPE
jgi:hypothetical protein